MRVPYPRDQLLLALANVDQKLYVDPDSIKDSLVEILNIEQPLLNLKAAEYHGVPVLDLINSPNYETLLKTFQESLVKGGVTFLEERGLTHVEAWAFICVIFGVLEV